MVWNHVNSHCTKIDRQDSRIRNQAHQAVLSQSVNATKVFAAIVIVPNEKTTDLGSLLAIARNEACKREHTHENPTIRTLTFVPELAVYVAIYDSTTNLQKENCERQGTC
jgi:hypothetical protein